MLSNVLNLAGEIRAAIQGSGRLWAGLTLLLSDCIEKEAQLEASFSQPDLEANVQWGVIQDFTGNMSYYYIRSDFMTSLFWKKLSSI